MTSFTQLAIGGTVVAMGLQASISAIVREPAPEKFLVVTRMDYQSGVVDFERTVNWGAWAVWDVVVLDAADKAICEGHGRAFYGSREPVRQPMPVDEFVGDPTCADKIEAGYVLQASWVPHDGTPTVVERRVIKP